jgi:hypothetical protein
VVLPHECRVIIFDVHIELADIRCEEAHDRAVIRKLPPRYCFEDALDAAIFRSRFEPKVERFKPASY